jgi:hypothetical protein
MMGKQNHVVWLMKRLSLNDLGPFDLHPAGCRRLAIGLSVGVRHIYLRKAPSQKSPYGENDIDNHYHFVIQS